MTNISFDCQCRVGGRGRRTLNNEVDLRSLGLLLGLYRAGVGPFIVDVHLEEERGWLSSGTCCAVTYAWLVKAIPSQGSAFSLRLFDCNTNRTPVAFFFLL